MAGRQYLLHVKRFCSYILASEELFHKMPTFRKYLCGNYIVFIYALMHQNKLVCKSLAQAAEE